MHNDTLDMSRRAFAGAMGLAAVAPAALAMAGESAKGDASAAKDASAREDGTVLASGASVPLEEDVERLCERGGTSLTVPELNRIRRERVEAAKAEGDFVKEDGTVVPSVWHQLDVLINTYGYGSPDPATGEALDYLMVMFDNDEEAAQHYLDMPWGKLFTAGEYAEKSGLTVDECADICEDLAGRGLLYRAERGDGVVYHHVAYVHGFFEQSIPRLYDPKVLGVTYKNLLGAPSRPPLVNAGTPIYYSVPCNEQIVGDERILPLNDYRELVERHDHIALLPCCCSLRENLRQGADVPAIGSEEMKDFQNVYGAGHHLERCLAFGEEAEYYIAIGAGRELTKDEAYEILDRNVDEGLVLQMGYTRNSEFICSCHSDCCGVLGSYRALDEDTWMSTPIRHNVSNYLLQYDKDACLKCGACAERCPMLAITMDDDGYPTVDDYCVRCGQCGLVCPAGARTLTARPADDRLPVPDNHMDDHNRKFGYRVEHGLK